MLKHLSTTLLLATALIPLVNSSTPPVVAQERQGCFMVDATGRLRDLSSICPSAAPFQSAETPTLGTGDIQVTLRWATTDDLDLAVTDPSGETVSYQATQIPSGGALDVDANAGCGESDTTPIENIFWPPSEAPQGSYSIEVNLFTRCAGSNAPIPFELRLLVQGNVQTLTGVVDDNTASVRFPFSLPSAPAQAQAPQAQQ